MTTAFLYLYATHHIIGKLHVHATVYALSLSCDTYNRYIAPGALTRTLPLFMCQYLAATAKDLGMHKDILHILTSWSRVVCRWLH